MFANINDIYLFHNAILNKNQSGSITPADFNLFINAAQQQYMRVKLGLPELYTVEKREAPQEIQTTQVIDDSVRRFVTPATLVKNGIGFTPPADMVALIPSGYLYVYQNPDGSTATSRQPIDFVSFGEYWNQINNYITFPTFEYPIATWLSGQLIVEPQGINQMQFYYYRYPVTPVFAFTVNANDQIVYDAANSVQLEFPNLDWENIAHIAIKYSSQYLREEFAYQTESSRIEKGT